MYAFLGFGFCVWSRVLKAKEWKVLADVSAHKGAVTDVQFGSAARFLASTSMDKSLKFFE